MHSLIERRDSTHMDFNNKLERKASQRPLIAAHRGVSGANIPCNTLAAYNIALLQGADIVELDVSRSRDGVLYAFHPGMEHAHLKSKRFIASLNSRSVNRMRFVNLDNVKTHYPVSTLEEAFAFLKDKCYINVDKFWTYPAEITAMIRKCGVDKQVIIKTPAEEKHFANVEKYAPDLMYMTVISEEDRCTDALLKRNINYIGAEVLFSREDSPAISEEYIKQMHDKGLLIFGNAIVYNEKANISAGHTDDAALTQDMNAGWGWFEDKGFDIIQTDWVQMLREYLENRG